MQKITCFFIALCIFFGVAAQELYVSTEPASNMASGSIGLRMNSKFFRMNHDAKYSYRLDPEIMFGVNKHLMVHVNMYGSNMYQSKFRMEGASLYGKYRVYSYDDVHSHFRMAAYGKMSLINNPTVLKTDQGSFSSDEIDLDGNNSGWLAGMVATQLLHKLAISSSVSFANRLDNVHDAKMPGQSATAINYSLSGGYLLFPREYRNYRQTNINLYCELLAATALDKHANFLDIAPAVQFIINSIARLDFSYRTQLTGNMERLSDSYFLVRFEYNLLNVFKNNQ